MTRAHLDLELELSGLHLIEASAGTGKTWNIAGIYARLIVEKNLRPAEILVMTFTRAATEELRARLRRRLMALLVVLESARRGADGASNGVSDAEVAWGKILIEGHIKDSGETRGDLERRLRGAMQSMDEAAISTIHGFCQRMLREFAPWIESTTASKLEDDRDLILDFATDFWLRVAAAGDPVALAALADLARDPAALARTLGNLSGFHGLLETAPAEHERQASAELLGRRDGACADLVATWQRDGEAAVASLMAVLGKKVLHETPFKPASCPGELDQILADFRLGRLPGHALLEKYCATKINKARSKAHQDFEPHAAFHAIDRYLESLAAIDAACAMERAALVTHLHAEFRARLATRKRELERLSYDDLIGRLADAMQGPHGARLASALRQRYPVALIDEFQDTDARQFGILEPVYRSHGALFMIGDPKQAIYGFRGGDLHAYLRVAAKPEVKRHTLDVNFRSSPAVLRAVTALFNRVDHPFLVEQIGFVPVSPGGLVKDGGLTIKGAAQPALTLWPKPDDLKADAARLHFAKAAAATVSQLLREGRIDGAPIAHRRIAVLANTNREIALVQDALAALGIASACVRRESIYATREARELLRIFDALLAPQSMRDARAALATRVLGHRLSDLARLAGSEPEWTRALAELAELRMRWFERGVLAMVQWIGTRHAQRLLGLAEGERVVGNLLQLAESLAAAARASATPRALRNQLARAVGAADDQNEEEQLRLESDAERVQVMTVHGAKGLEFDAVLLPFACMMDKRGVARGKLLDHMRGDTRIKHWLLNAREDRSAEDTAAIEGHVHAEHAEILRKFYVGVTRAARALWVSSADGFALKHLLGDDVAGQALAAEFTQDIRVAAPPPAAAWRADGGARLGPARNFSAFIRRDWRRHSFSALTRGDYDPAAARHDEIPGAADEGFAFAGDVPILPGGAAFGSAVHAVLENTDFASWRDAHEIPAGEFERIERALRAEGIATSRKSDLVAETARLIARTLATEILPGCRLNELPSAARRAEMEFDFGIGGAAVDDVLALLHRAGYQLQRRDFALAGARLRGLMNGIIDLVFVHERRWYIVDYKTNNLGSRFNDYRPEALARAIAEHDYDLQYLIYTLALYRWLRQSLGDGFDYARDFGGVRYLFLRGLDVDRGAELGVHADRPSGELIASLDRLLATEAMP